MKKLNPKQKKIFLSAIALVLVAAIGVGIWFGTKGSAEPVNVYPFDFIGMTEYWGDNQESYGPVSTDKIQTVYLSDTQTVTEILAAEGDEVKKGDVLMTFDTTLTELELERKRLEVERQKLDLQDAQAELRKILGMKPMNPNVPDIPIVEPEEPDLGDVISSSYEISQNGEYDGSSVEKALICWLKDGIQVNDPVLRAIRMKALAYQEENAKKQNSSASAPLTTENGGDLPTTPTLTESEPTVPTPPESEPTNPDPTDPAPTELPPTEPEPTELPTEPEPTEPAPTDPEPTPPADTTNAVIHVAADLYIRTGSGLDYLQPYPYELGTVTVGTDGAIVNGYDYPQTLSYDGEIYVRQGICLDSDGRLQEAIAVEPYPQNADAQAAWLDKWEYNLILVYALEDEQPAPSGLRIESNDVNNGGEVTVKEGESVNLLFSSTVQSPQQGATVQWDFSPKSGGSLVGTPNGNSYTISGIPEEVGSTTYTVTARYLYDKDGNQQPPLEATYTFTLNVEEDDSTKPTVDDYYVIIKVTQDDLSRADRMVWQGMHVFCYEGGGFGFTFFDASSLEDHTLEEQEEIETDVELPDFDPGGSYTATELAKMRAEQELKVREQELSLRMAEAEYKIMQAEVNDGKVCADFDGKVVSVLTEEDARQEKRPLLKVSAGGGFYVEVSVSELEMEKLKIGQEVTINDWNTGMTYTGSVDSIGDFPVSPNGWSSSDNANVTYYPFTVFVDSSADLQAGNYVNVTYSTSASENGVYVENAFIRTEQGRSYVFVEGENGKLEKRYVTVGKSLWGSYTQVLSGVTEDDFLAFPYGKTVKEGAPAVENENLSSLYSY